VQFESILSQIARKDRQALRVKHDRKIFKACIDLSRADEPRVFGTGLRRDKRGNCGQDRNPNKSILEKRIQGRDGVGLAVTIIDKDQKDIFTIGLADTAKDRKIDAETLFEIGSITKTFTGILLADMVIKGEVKLEDPISKYLPPSVRLSEFDGKQITLKDLATHSSALPR